MKVRDTFKGAIENTSLFKSLSFGIIPPPSQIKKFPAVAIDMVKTEFERRSGCSFWANTTVDIFIYNRTTSRQAASKDILELVEDVDRALQTDEALNDIVTDVYVESILSDGGISHPVEVYKVTIHLTYLTNNDYNK